MCWGLTSQHTSCGYTRVSIKETSEDTAESRCTKKGCIVTLETLKLFLRTSSTNTYGTSQMEKLVAGPWKGKPVIKYSRQHGCTIYMIQNKHSIVHPCNSKMAILLLKWHKPEEQEKWIFVLRRKRTLSQINLLPMGHGSAHHLGPWTEELYLHMIICFSYEWFQVDSNFEHYYARTFGSHWTPQTRSQSQPMFIY